MDRAKGTVSLETTRQVWTLGTSHLREFSQGSLASQGGSELEGCSVGTGNLREYARWGGGCQEECEEFQGSLGQ